MMQYLAYISIGFIAFQFFNVLLNFFFRQKIKKSNLASNEKISVLIPARNEEQNIHLLLSDLQKMKNENLEIIVFDDQSTDNTFNIIQEFADADRRIKGIQSSGLPDAWLGKNNACFQLAQRAKGNYFLFVDADVSLHGNIIEEAVAHLEKHKLGLLSVFPTQIQKTWGEKISVPIMNYILLTLLPLIFVRVSPFASHAAANGQFMLFNALTYKKTQPHKTFKSSAVEDIAISRFFKKEKIKIACLTGEKRIKCRMYSSYNEAKIGFTKNVFMFFGNQPVLAFLFWIFATVGFIPILVSQAILLPIYFALVVLIQILYSITSKQNVGWNLLFFPIQLLFLGQLLVKAVLTKKNKQYKWKGRDVFS